MSGQPGRDDLMMEKSDPLQKQVNELRGSGLFDGNWYLEKNPDVKKAGDDPYLHFCICGWKEGRKPNDYFDISYYRAQMSVSDRDSVNPILHYAREGEKQGLKPSLYFDPLWYRSHYGLSQTKSPLRHYLQHASSGKFSPIPEFDVNFYLDAYSDIGKSHIDAFLHYLYVGSREGRNPSRDFNTVLCAAISERLG
jgi:hypothetical protein